MGTFSRERNEYDDPQVPPGYTGRNYRKAFMRGWLSGIWHEQTTPPVRYLRANLQRAFESGYLTAHQARRDRGERI